MVGGRLPNSDGLYDQDPETRKYIFPDQLSFHKEPFATVIPYRSPAFKVHKSEGLANSALSHHKEGAKYKQENGVWVKTWEFYEPIECESCHLLLDETRDRTRNYYGRYGDYYRSPLHKGSEIFAPFLCLSCYENEDAIVRDRQKARQWAAEQKRRALFDASNKN